MSRSLPSRPQVSPNVEPEDRREHRRFEADGALLGRSVRVRSGGLLGLLQRDAFVCCDLVDLSCGGACFVAGRSFKPQQPIAVLLEPAGAFEPLRLLAQVRWCVPIDAERYKAGAQFKAFGSRVGYNPLDALEALRRLERALGGH